MYYHRNKELFPNCGKFIAVLSKFFSYLAIPKQLVRAGIALQLFLKAKEKRGETVQALVSRIINNNGLVGYATEL